MKLRLTAEAGDAAIKHCFLMLLLGVLWACAKPARAELIYDLYRGEAIVTGQENLDERKRGFGEALVEAVVKVSGDARLATHARLMAALGNSERLVARFEYEDRLAKKKLMDEQGTRERSYLLRVDFHQTAVDRLLAELGARPWPADRPRLLVLLVVRDSVGSYLLAGDSARGWGQREALAAVSRRRGLPAVLPRLDAAGGAELAMPEGQPPENGAILRLAKEYAADAVLQGRMIMRADGQWDTCWTLQAGQAHGSWRSYATTFDRAIASGLEGSALRMTGAH